MAKMRKSKKSKFFFNLDIYEENEDKQYKARKVSMDKFEDVVEFLKKKFG